MSPERSESPYYDGAPPQRSWSATKIVAVGLLGLIPLIIGFFAYAWYSAHAEVKSRLTELANAGLPTSAAGVNDYYRSPEGVPDLSNVWMRIIDAVAHPGAEVNESMKDLPIVGEGPTPIPPPGQEWAEFAGSRALVQVFGKELEEARSYAGQRGEARYPVDFRAGIATLLPYAQDSRQLARILMLDAYVAAHEENSQRAFDDIRAIFAVSDSLRNEPLLISQLVRLAINSVAAETLTELLPHLDWNDAQLELLQREVQAADFAEEMRRALHGERGILITEVGQHSVGPLSNSNQRELLLLFDTALENWDAGWSERLSQQKQVESRFQQLEASYVSRLQMHAVLILFPATSQAVQASIRGNARQRCLNAILAAQRHRLRHRKLPDSLEEIDKDLLGPESEATSLIDPFDGRLLRFLNEKDHIAIYSISQDLVDDGGNYRSSSQGGAPTDVGFSLQR